MVIVQVDIAHVDHVICYLIRGLVGANLQYPYVEKLALEIAFVVQHFYHYIIL